MGSMLVFLLKIPLAATPCRLETVDASRVIGPTVWLCGMASRERPGSVIQKNSDSERGYPG